jgi:tetratricopeptide (TPR) repeat protein
VNLRNLVTKKAVLIGAAAVGITAGCIGMAFVMYPVYQEFKGSFAAKEFKKYGLVETYRKRYHLFFEKMDNLATADMQEESLLRNLAEVRKELEVEKSKHDEVEIRKESNKIADHLKKHAGSHLARVPDGIEYEVPSNMMAHQLLVLGLEYFRKHDYEKSAMIFDELMNKKNDRNYQVYQKADHFMVTAISWYKIKHYDLAASYFEKAQKSTEKGSALYRQSILWQSMVRKAVGDQHGSQRLLTQLISYHSQSEEAAMINGKRKPASHSNVHQKESEHTHGEKHDAHGGKHE